MPERAGANNGRLLGMAPACAARGTRCPPALSTGFVGAVSVVLLPLARGYVAPPGPGNRQGGEGDDVEGQRSYTVLLVSLVWIASPEKR